MYKSDIEQIFICPELGSMLMYQKYIQDHFGFSINEQSIQWLMNSGKYIKVDSYKCNVRGEWSPVTYKLYIKKI
jgi:hypothetical protein